MIIGIELPKDAKVEISNGKVLVMFDEAQFRHNQFFAASLGIWLTEGQTPEDFNSNPALNKKTSLVVPKSRRAIRVE